MDNIRKAAVQIMDCCKRENIKKVYSCITRLRLVFQDKDMVDYGKLEEIPVVKGIFWYGDECQILIGLEAMAISETMNMMLP